MPKPNTRDKETTVKTILNAAEELFAEKGFHGTSIRAISKKCGVSGPLILFHFQSKQQLYQQVKAAIIQRYDSGQAPHTVFDGSLRGFLEKTIRTMFAFYRENPTIKRLANWGRLEGDLETWPGEEEWHHAWIEDIEKAQAAGVMRQDVSAYDVLVMLSGAIHVWWEYHEHFLEDKRMTDEPRRADDDYAETLLDVLERGLAVK